MKKLIFLLLGILILTLIVSGLLFVSYTDWKVEGYSNLPDEKTGSLKNCFAIAEEYKNEKFGSNYELYGIHYELYRDEEDRLTFTYTKRKGLFKNVYFVTIDRINKELKCTGQAEANRLYGRDLHLDVENWTFDFDIVYDIGKDFVYDQILFESRHENEILLRFINQNETVFSTYIDVLQ